MGCINAPPGADAEDEMKASMNLAKIVTTEEIKKESPKHTAIASIEFKSLQELNDNPTFVDGIKLLDVKIGDTPPRTPLLNPKQQPGSNKKLIPLSLSPNSIKLHQTSENGENPDDDSDSEELYQSDQKLDDNIPDIQTPQSQNKTPGVDAKSHILELLANNGSYSDQTPPGTTKGKKERTITIDGVQYKSKKIKTQTGEIIEIVELPIVVLKSFQNIITKQQEIIKQLHSINSHIFDKIRELSETKTGGDDKVTPTKKTKRKKHRKHKHKKHAYDPGSAKSKSVGDLTSDV